MPKRTGDFKAWRLEKLSDPVNAAHYLNAALEDSPDVFLDAFRDVFQARKHVSQIAKEAGVTRESLYRSFSASGNPTLDTLCSVLKVLELELKIEAGAENALASNPMPQAARSTRSRKPRKRHRTSGNSQQPSLSYESAALGAIASTSTVPSLSTMTRSTTSVGARINPLEQSIFGTSYLPDPSSRLGGLLRFNTSLAQHQQPSLSSPAAI
jgi:probable addiction module antidote protein